MGCVTSKKDINDIHPHIFQVENVDEVGNTLSSGRLEVNETELVLYQRDKPPVRWPLKSLRRYGYEKEYFSFEAGRRCPTGSGVYAFNCRRAEKLFNFVQAYVQVGGEEREAAQPGSTPLLQVEPYYLEPRSDSTTSSSRADPASVGRARRLSLRNSSRLSSVTSSNGCTSPSTPNYINDDPFMHPLSEEPPVEVVPLPGGTAGQPCYENVSLVTESRAYMNVDINRIGTDAGWNGERPTGRRMSVERNSLDLSQHVIRHSTNALPESPVELSSPQHCYANLQLGEAGKPLSLPSAPPYIRQVNYAVLDLDDKSQSFMGPVSPTESVPREGYVTIDFDRTVALSQSASSSLVLEGVRKTRHDSTVASDLMSQTSSRHSACLSE